VIDFANKVCAFLFSACENTVGYRPQDDLVCSKSTDGITAPAHPAPVTLAVFDAPPRKKAHGEDEDDAEDVREEAVWVAAEISRILREETLDNGAPVRPSDIAILVRNKNHGATYTDELTKLGIPVLSPTSSDIAKDPLLYDMLNLLKSVDNPWRDLPLSEFLLSPLGGFDLEELTAIREATAPTAALYDALLTVAENEAHPLFAKCTSLISWLDEARRLADTQPADRFLRLLYQDDRLANLSDTPVLLYLYEQARIYQKNAFCGLYGFLSHFAKLLEGNKLSAEGFGAAEDAVTVMTVHHSKGLEFPVVFLSSTGSPFNKDDMKKSLLYHRDVGIACRLYDEASGNLEETALRAALCLKVDAEQVE
jgi:ATP-dependent helicase/nuclease subunit A